MSLAASVDAVDFVPRAPAPRARPAGRLAQLVGLARNPLTLWSERHYDDLIVQEIGVTGGPLITVSEPAAVRRVLLDNAANYPKDLLQLRVLTAGSPPGSGRGLLVADGDLWKRTRRTLAPLFSPRHVAKLAHAMARPALARVESWRGRSDIVVDAETTGLAYDMLSATLFSDALGRDADDAQRRLETLLDSIGRIHPFDVLGLSDRVPRFGRGPARAARIWFAEATERLADERAAQAARGQTPPDDLLTALVQAQDPETGVGLSKAEVTANLFTLIAAGHETTARALAWTLHLLARAPRWQARCAEEARTADLVAAPEAAPTIRAAFEEAMRLFPPAPMLARAAREADRLGGVDVAPNTFVVVAPWLIQRHRKLWERPDAFDPARFLPGAREKIDRYAYLPFGAGPRVCIGQSFAMQEAMVALIAALRAYEFAPMGPEPDPLHRITLKFRGPLRLAITPR